MPVLTPNERVTSSINRDRLTKGRTDDTIKYRPRPTIGVSVNFVEAHGATVARAYTDAILLAGGLPLALPLTDSEEMIDAFLDNCDGLLLTGGADISPHYMGEDACQHLGSVCPERDRYDFTLVRRAAERNIPILGICRGHQVIAAAFGGEVYQDIYSQGTGTVLNHNPAIPRTDYVHRLDIKEADSVLHRLAKATTEGDIWVNSIHHQAVKAVPAGFLSTAIAPDGFNEAMEAYPEKAILSVQWHPEHLAMRGQKDAFSLALFEHIVEEASLYARAKAVHQHAIILDSHVDTPMHFEADYDFRKSERTMVDLRKMKDGMVDAVQMVAYLPQRSFDETGDEEAYAYAIDRLERIRDLATGSLRDEVIIASTPEAIRQAKARGLKAIVPAIENGYALGDDLSRLRIFRDLGVTYITLCHNGDNLLCDSANRTKETHGGISPLGRDAIAEMNRLGIMIDISHASDSTVSQALEISCTPIVASHSSARALCDHPRNLSDDLIRGIAAKGGVVQVCLYTGFLKKDDRLDHDSNIGKFDHVAASVNDAVDHIDYIRSLVGVEHVGIGSDFDGGGELIGCRNTSDLIQLTMELLRRNYTPNDISLLWGGNWLRVMAEVQRTGRYLQQQICDF